MEASLKKDVLKSQSSRLVSWWGSYAVSKYLRAAGQAPEYPASPALAGFLTVALCSLRRVL